MPTVQEWVDGYGRAWIEKDADAVAELFTKDATYRANIFEEPHHGSEGIADYWRSVTAGQSNVRVLMGRPFESGDRVAVEFWTNMTVGGDEVTLPGCLLLDFDSDGLCRRLREYWHFQPGNFDPPDEWGQ